MFLQVGWLFSVCFLCRSLIMRLLEQETSFNLQTSSLETKEWRHVAFLDDKSKCCMSKPHTHARYFHKDF